MKHIDELFKDSSPVETVERIRGIFKDFGVSLNETWYESGVSNCYTVRVDIDGTSKGANGKGVTKELARASGHAELMERFQSGHKVEITPDSFTDGKYMTAEELFESCGEFYEKIAKSLNLVYDKKVNAQKLMSKAFAIENNPEKILALPYYDVMNDKVVYLPHAFVRLIYGSNGKAAGNSINEALVQGFSEIVERYAMKMIFVDRLTPPTVPDEILCKYETAFKTITNLRAIGYDVVIKDCSIGLGYPVVAAVFIDKKKHKYHIHFGSSPVFEIALERSLTEGFQGRNIENVADVSSDFATYSLQNVLMNFNRASRNGTGAFPSEFFKEESSYPLITPKDFTGLGNKELIKEVIAFAERTGCSVFVRNMSHLGFDTYKIIIPEFSELFFSVSTFATDVPYYLMYNSLGEARANPKKASAAEITMLNSLVKTKEITHEFSSTYSNLSGINAVYGDRNAFLGRMYTAYLAWELHDMPRVMNIIAKAMRYEKTGFDRDYIDCIKRVYKLTSEGVSLKDALYALSFLFDEEVINTLKEVYETRVNPFARYIVDCTPEDCSGCAYIESCSKKKVAEMSKKLSSIVKEFDTEAAFEKVVKTFKEARS